MSKAKLLGFFIGTGVIAFHFYNKHMYEMEYCNQINKLFLANEKLSGVYLQQRQPFGSLGYFQWLLPYHQSLKIYRKDGSVRQVGLGHRKGSSMFDRTVEFVLHEGGKFGILNQYEISIPIEAWVDYEREYGHFPTKIDIEALISLTLTHKEVGDKGDHLISKVGFGNIINQNGKMVIRTCRSEVMRVIRESELSKQSNTIE